MNRPEEAFENPQTPFQTKSQARAARRAEKATKNGLLGAALSPKNASQREYMDRLRKGESVFGIGPAGTGKTYIPARMAARKLIEMKIEKIIICRVTVSNTRHALGFLPGRLDQKLSPWLVPVLDGIKAEVSAATLDKWRQENRVEIASFEHMRGRTFRDCCIILDEAQNATFADLKLFLTRIGENCQVVVTGDDDQIDIKDSGLLRVMQIGEDAGVPMAAVRFSEEDVVRSAFTKAWVSAFAADKNGTVGNLDRLPDFIHTAKLS